MASRRSSSPVTQRRSPGSSPSPSPPRVTPLGRRRLWNPPPRPRTPTKDLSRSSARSAAPQHVYAACLPSAIVIAAPRPQPPRRNRRSAHRSHFNSCPPSTYSSSQSEDGPGSVRLMPPKNMPPASPTVLRPHPTQSLVHPRPPPTQHGSRMSRCVASTIVAAARKRVQPRPPTPEDIQRVNRKLRALAL